MEILREHTTYHEFALVSKYDKGLIDFCRSLQAILGWKEINWKDNKWRFKDPMIIKMFQDRYPDIKIAPEVVILVEEHKKRILVEAEREKNADRIKNSTESDLKIKGIKGELYPYQKLGVEFLTNSGGRALLADAPGVGKTAQALGFLVHTEQKRTLIICPASVKFSWESEIKKWTHLKSFIVTPKTELRDIPSDVNCIIINFDVLKKHFNELAKYRFDTFVIDESHFIKSMTAQRTKAVKALSRNVNNVIMLTGTPVLSRPIEMFNMLNIIDPNAWSSYYNFAVRYAGGKQGYWGFEAKGATNLEELKQRISKYFLRRTKEEVLKDLPPKVRAEIPIELPPEARKNYDLAEENLVQYLKKKDKTNKQIMKSMQAEKLVKLNILREINTMGKIPTAKELIENIVEAGEKVLVFSSFNAPLIELAEEFEESSVMILGSTPVEERGEVVKKFQNDPKTKIFFGGMKSAGVGITLTAASHIINLDLPWNPADLEQAENRAHRPGAEYECLNIHTIICRDTIDGFMSKLLNKKQEIINQIIGEDISESDDELINDYIKTLEAKHK